MAGERFYLVFSEEPNTKYWIDEPVNYSEVDFVLEQKENRMGRDESLNGGENRFRFVDYRNHYIEKLFYYYHKKGFEAEIVLGIVTVLGAVYESELHFVDVETDEITYLECRTISKSSSQIIKSRRETKVDMFASIDIDGNYIDPLVPTNMLLKAKPSVQISEWKTEDEVVLKQYMFGNDRVYFLPMQQLISSGIESSFVTFGDSVYFSPTSGSTDEDAGLENYNYITASSNLKNIKVKIKIGSLAISHQSTAGSIIDVAVYYGQKPRTERTYIQLEKSTVHSMNLLNKEYEVLIPSINRGDKIWFSCSVTQTTPISTGGYNGVVSANYKNLSMIITSESTSYNSIVPVFRLIDVMRQVVKSISGQSVFSQRYDFAGQLYDNVFFNGNLMRSESDKPFYVSLKDIEDFIWGEHKGDSEIQEDGTVFFGIEKDFYTDVECGFFDDTQFEDMVKNTNQKYALNEFKFKYGKYQSLKENTEPNSDSTIHGESIWTFYNRRAPNKLEISIDPVRDAILIDVQQRLATKVSKDTATQDDDTIFVVDVIETTSDFSFTETTNLQHTSVFPNLSLRSDGEVNFVTLGIKPFTTFIIETPNVNAGTFLVQSVTTTEIILSGGIWSNVNNGVKLTKYTYEIKQDTIPLTNRTDQGFTAISELISPDKYSNLRYSIKRNILNYWNSTLATVNLFWKDKLVRSTYYKNNGKCNTTYAGLTVVENDPFIPKDPIVSANKYENLTFVNVDFDDYIILRNKIKKDRGYIRAINKKNRVIKVYPEKVTYVNSEKKLVISGEEKFEKAFLTISNEGGIILVNNEMKMIRLIWEFDENSQEILLFDRERQRLYNGVFWDKVSLNSAVADTKEELFSWLRLLE